MRRAMFVVIARAVALSSALAIGGVACAPAKPPTTSLRLAPTQDAPKNARVIIDDQPVGSLDFITKRGVALPPGKHRITIEAEGWLPWDAEVDAGDKGGLLKLDVKMVKVPD